MKIKEIVCEVDGSVPVTQGGTKPETVIVKNINPFGEIETQTPAGKPVTLPKPTTPGQLKSDPNNPKNLLYTLQKPLELKPGEQVTVQTATPGQTVAEDHDDLESKSDRELMKIAREQDIDEDEFRIIDGELVNRDDIIILIRGDIKGGDETDSLINQVTDPLYGYHALSEIRALAGIK